MNISSIILQKQEPFKIYGRGLFNAQKHIASDFERDIFRYVDCAACGIQGRYCLINIISYDTKSQNIKIEVNRRNFGSKYDMKTLLGISMLVMVREDMFAHKLMDMRERVGKTSRDIYDVWFLLKNNWPINKEIVEQRSGTTFKKLLKMTAEQLEKFNNKNILVGLGEFLTESQKDWARAKLRTETIFLLKARLESEK